MHVLLGLIGFVPGLGDFFDLLDAGISALQGDWKGAGISLLAAAGVGAGAGLMKLFGKTLDSGEDMAQFWNRLPDGPKGGGEVLVRRGTSPESATRLGRQAQQAEDAGLPHGVSVTTPESNLRLSRDPSDASTATRGQFEEAGFPVHDTPTRRDPNHKTVELPKPVTTEDAKTFNDVLGRESK